MKHSSAPVVDFHLHLNRLDATMQPWWVERMTARFGPNVGRMLEDKMSRPALEAFMDDNGVDYSVCLAELSPITTGMAPNEWVVEVCAGSPRLLPFANINPSLTSRPAVELRRLVCDLGMKGLKLLPSYHHFFPNDASLYPLYSVAEELGVPVTFHTGSSVFQGSRLKYSQPIHLDDVAVDFPGLTIVMAHSGRTAWFDEAWLLSRIHKNVYMEVAGLPPAKLLTYWPDLERNAGKVLFGSDWPDITSIKHNIAAVRDLGLSPSATELILGGNAARILGLPPRH